jgi:hypothetical protein
MNKIQTKRGTCKIQFGHLEHAKFRPKEEHKKACMFQNDPNVLNVPTCEREQRKKKQSRSRNCTPWKFLVPDVQVGILLPHPKKITLFSALLNLAVSSTAEWMDFKALQRLIMKISRNPNCRSVGVALSEVQKLRGVARQRSCIWPEQYKL